MAQFTPEQAARLVGGSVSDIKPMANSQTASKVQPEKKGFLSRLGTGIAESFQKRDVASDTAFASDQNFGSQLLQSAGQAAGFIGDVGVETLKAGYQSLPQGVQDLTKATGVELLNTAPGQAGLNALKGGLETWNGFKESNPEVAKNLEAVVNIASVLPVVKATGMVGKGIVKAGEKGIDMAQTGLKAVPELAQTAKREVGAGLASIPKQMQTEFRPAVGTAVENIPKTKASIGQTFEKYVSSSEQHAVSVANKRPDAVFGDAANDTIPTLKSQMKAAAETKKIALGENGNKVIRGVDKFVESFANKIKNDLGIVYDQANGTFKDAPGRVSKIGLDAADNTMLKKVYEKVASLGANPTITKADDLIDSIQDILNKRSQLGAVKVNSRVEGLLNSTTGKLNTVVKKIGGESYTQANAQYKRINDAFQELNKELGKKGVSGASLMKKLFSPAKNEQTRRLFTEIKELTGIDLFQEATFAKFVMESSSDTAQKSLIQAITQSGGLGQTGMTGYLLKKGIDKLVNPIEKARKLINK
jgi:archaellum component FlaC